MSNEYMKRSLTSLAYYFSIDVFVLKVTMNVVVGNKAKFPTLQEV